MDVDFLKIGGTVAAISASIVLANNLLFWQWEADEYDARFNAKIADIHVMITEHLIDEDDKSICFWETYDLPAEKKLPHYKMCETEKNRHGTRRLLERLTR